jgi:hypothetical protein
MSPRDKTKKKNNRLPRLPNADKVRADERVLKRGGADLQNGWLARHGELTLTDDRLVFQPTIIDTLMRAKRREISLDNLHEIERFPLRPGDMPLGGRRPRMLLHTPECVYEFMVGDLDGWIDIFELVYRRRRRLGREHTPTITREDYINVLLMED